MKPDRNNQNVGRDWARLILVILALVTSSVGAVGFLVGRKVSLPRPVSACALIIASLLAAPSLSEMVEVRLELIDRLQHATKWAQVQQAVEEVVVLDVTFGPVAVCAGALSKRLAQHTVQESAESKSIAFGNAVGGHSSQFMNHGEAVFDTHELRRHAVVLGSTGSGKTVTTMHLASGAARLGWSVWYVDAKGDHDNAADFYNACINAGLERNQITGWPYQPWDAWRGDSRDIANRILATQDFTEPYYREAARLGIRLAIEAPGSPTPRTSTELLDALDDRAIATAWRGSAAARSWGDIDKQTRLGVSMRLHGFFSSIGNGLDGTVGFEDKRAGYFAIDAVSLKDASESVGKLLIEDLTHWAARRKPKADPALVIIDEFSAISSSSDQVAGMIERLRGFNVAVVLVSQSLLGLGDHGERILDACGTLVLHQGSDPEKLTNRAGTFTMAEPTMQVDGVGPTGMGSLRLNDQFCISPNDVRRLDIGECFVVHSGAYLKVKVHPPAEAAVRPPQWWGVIPAPPRPVIPEHCADLEGLEL